MRNIFNMDKKVSKHVLGLYKSTTRNNDNTDERQEEEAQDDDNGDAKCSIPHINGVNDGEEQVTQESMQKLNEELRELRSKLIQSKRRREVFEHHLERVQEVKKQSTVSVKSVRLALQQHRANVVDGDNNSNGNLHELVSAVVMGREGLMQVREEGLELLKRMDEKHLLDDQRVNSVGMIRAQKPSLEEDYAVFRKKLKTQDVTQVAALVEKLKNGNDEELSK